jgi:hypothetical protein
MLIVDDILLFPLRGIHWIAREMYNAAQQELAGQAAAITAELSELYRMFERGEISEEEFDRREKELLDRLERMNADAARTEAEEEEREDEGAAGRNHREAANA